MKILVIRFSSIGDIVLTTPVIRCLKQGIPGVVIHYLTKPGFAEILSDNPYLDRIIPLGEDFDAMIAGLKRENYDYVADLHCNLRTARVKLALGVRSGGFPKLNFLKWLLVNFKLNRMPEGSIVDRYFHAVRSLGVENDGKGLDYFLPGDAGRARELLPERHQTSGFAAFVIGGSYFTKRLPVVKWKELARALDRPVVLLGGPADREAAAQIAATEPEKIFNACGICSLSGSAYLVKQADIVYTNDTGLMHIAAAFRKRIVSFWGNTVPELGMYPYYGTADKDASGNPLGLIAEHDALSCRPCSKLGYNRCPKGHFKCMNELDMSGPASAGRRP